MSRTLSKIFFVIFLLFTVVSAFLAFVSPFDGHDGYVFIDQARRLSDPAFRHFPFVFFRPRGLVFILSVYDRLIHFFTSHYPTIGQYHIVSWSLVLLFIAAWVKTIGAYFHKSVGWLTGIFLSVHYLVLYSATFVMSDILTGFLWAGSSYGFLRLTDSSLTARKRLFYTLATGVAAGLMAASKYQYFFLFPILMSLSAFTRWAWIPGFKRTAFKDFPFAPVLFVYVLTIEIVQRISGELSSGFCYTVKLYAFYMKNSSEKLLPSSPKLVYLNDFYQSYGPLFCALTMVSMLLFLWRRREIVEVAVRRPEVRSAPKILWLIANALYFALNQLISHREPRYLLPVLPVGLALIALSFIESERKLKPALRLAWAALLLVALIHPINLEWQTTQALRQQYASWNAAQYDRFWNYLNSSEDGKCEAVLACQTELDLTYYDHYLPRVPSRVHFCQGDPSTYRSQLTDRLLPSYCYVIANSRLHDGFGNRVRVEKPIGLEVSSNEAHRILAADSKNESKCELSQDGNYNCFHLKDFFSGPSRSIPAVVQGLL